MFLQISRQPAINPPVRHAHERIESEQNPKATDAEQCGQDGGNIYLVGREIWLAVGFSLRRIAQGKEQHQGVADAENAKDGKARTPAKLFREETAHSAQGR